jgi:LPPG:FO 2-phospho-L-lactate transferase
LANKVVALAGGVGAAKFLRGLVKVHDPEELTVVSNVGDNAWIFGLYVAPDIDIVTYALADVWDDQRGWGIKGEGYTVRDWLKTLKVRDAEWFNLGDKDFATCAYRTMLIKQGYTLSHITDQLKNAMGVKTKIIPATDQELTTMVYLEGMWLSFEEYYVRLKAEPEVEKIEYKGAEKCEPSPGVKEALAEADKIIICPSNPVASIQPILAVKEIHNELRKRRSKVVVVSPLIQGKAVKGPADKMMASLGMEPSPLGLADYYSDIAQNLVIDLLDAEFSTQLINKGFGVRVLDTKMVDAFAAGRLASQILSWNSVL